MLFKNIFYTSLLLYATNKIDIYFSLPIMYKTAEAAATEMRGNWNTFRKQGIYQMYYGLSCFGLEMNIMRHPLWGRNQVW